MSETLAEASDSFNVTPLQAKHCLETLNEAHKIPTEFDTHRVKLPSPPEQMFPKEPKMYKKKEEEPTKI